MLKEQEEIEKQRSDRQPQTPSNTRTFRTSNET